MADLSPQNPRLLTELEPFVVATAANLDRFDLSPFGIDIAPEARIDALKTASASFLDALKHLDEATFGPEGMPMPRWMFFGGAELPGGIVGLGKKTDGLTKEARNLLRIPADHHGLVPYSMFIAIPTYETGVWLGHNLASLSGLLPKENLSGLGSLTKALGLRVFRATGQVGVTQWDSVALRVHTRLGPLALLTAWTPAHSEAWSLTYRAVVNEETLRHLARDPQGRVPHPDPTLWVDSQDQETMRNLQSEIEEGAGYLICGRPEQIGPGRLRVPVMRQ